MTKQKLARFLFPKKKVEKFILFRIKIVKFILNMTMISMNEKMETKNKDDIYMGRFWKTKIIILERN